MSWVDDTGWAPAMAGVALVLALLIGLLVVRRRHGRLAPLPTGVVVATVAYAAGLIALTLLPISLISALACKQVGDRWHLVPFRVVERAVDRILDEGVPAFLVSDRLREPLANVVLFVPLGVLIGWTTRRRLWVAILVGLVASVLIEATQATAVWGLSDCAYRYAETDDVIANTVGVGIGWFLGRRLGRRVPWPAPERGDAATDDDATVTAPARDD